MMRVHLPPAAEGFTVTVSELVLVPLVEEEAWIRFRLGDGGFTSDRVELETTACGWTALVAYGQRGGVATLRVFIRFLDLGAFAEATGDLVAAWSLVREARPDYTGELASIHQLFT